MYTPMELGCSPIVNPITLNNFSLYFFSQYCPKMFKNKSYEQVFHRLLTSFPQESQEIIFIFFLWESLLLFSFFSSDLPKNFIFYFYSDLPTEIKKYWPHNPHQSKFPTVFQLSLGFTICYNIVVPRERRFLEWSEHIRLAPSSAPLSIYSNCKSAAKEIVYVHSY